MLRSDIVLEKVTPTESRVVNLLPVLDSCIMGYKKRERYLSYLRYDKVFDRSGNATSTILLDGKVVSVWDFIEDKKKPSVKIFLFEQVENSVLSEIYCKARKSGRFITNKDVEVSECDSMLPLTHRTAGGFMTSLKSP